MDCAPPSCPRQCLRLLQIVSAVIPQSALLEYMCGQNNSLNDHKPGQSDYVHVMAMQNSDYCSMERGGDQNSRWWPPLGLWRPTLTSFTSLMHLFESKLLRFTYHYQCRDAATCMEYKLSPSLERRLGVLHNCTVCYQRGLLDLFLAVFTKCYQYQLLLGGVLLWNWLPARFVLWQCSQRDELLYF